MNVASVKSVACLLGYTVNRVTCIFIYTVSTHMVYIVCVFVCVCCNAKLTSCFIMSPLTERTGIHWGHPQQTPNKRLHKGQHSIFSHTAAKKRGPTFCLHPPFPTHIQSSESVDVGGYCCHELLSLCLSASDASSFSLRALLPSNVTTYDSTVKLVIMSHFSLVLKYVYSLYSCCFIIMTSCKSIRLPFFFCSFR